MWLIERCYFSLKQRITVYVWYTTRASGFECWRFTRCASVAAFAKQSHGVTEQQFKKELTNVRAGLRFELRKKDKNVKKKDWQIFKTIKDCYDTCFLYYTLCNEIVKYKLRDRHDAVQFPVEVRYFEAGVVGLSNLWSSPVPKSSNILNLNGFLAAFALRSHGVEDNVFRRELAVMRAERRYYQKRGGRVKLKWGSVTWHVF